FLKNPKVFMEEFGTKAIDQNVLEKTIFDKVGEAMAKKEQQRFDGKLETLKSEIEKERTLERKISKEKYSSNSHLELKQQLEDLKREQAFLLAEQDENDKMADDEDLVQKGILAPHEKNVDQDLLNEDYEERESFHGDSDDMDSMNEEDSENEEKVVKKMKLTIQDDGDEQFYRQRIEDWKQTYQELKDKDSKFDARYKIPGEIYRHLFLYQKTAARWLWELYKQRVGGIIGDEMGLGKTVQIISFLAGLHYSGMYKGCSLVVCPATVMHQWVKEFHRWYPPFRVAVLHKTGSHDGSYADLLHKMNSTGDILITTYSQLQLHQTLFLDKKWFYVVLDEGHKIRNPDSNITLVCKQLKTEFRIILSGTPIQNNLSELWSLFDFIYPGKLGTLPVFQDQFAAPIQAGGYAHATTLQIQTSYKCAVILRDLINPYLLRRMKADVVTHLPKKTEQVRNIEMFKIGFILKYYEDFIQSREMSAIFDGKRHVLVGIDYLRKLCNHPDLVIPAEKNTTSEERSGKMKVLLSALEKWKENGNKVLIFSQTRMMLDIIEHAVKEKNYSYLRMDGSTNVNQRMPLVEKFNQDSQVFCFLLTTKVGGLGINLTGADRVLIYDPDWNPSNDAQARERAWRLGQKKQVAIYRLIIAGTIEEKIYHRQIFKQFLTNKILKDPKQSRFFKTTELYDLFTLDVNRNDGNETTALLGHLGEELEMIIDGKKKKKKKNLSIDGVCRTDDHVEKDETLKNNDDSILDDVTKMAGIQGSLRHDIFVEKKRPDLKLIEKEAEKISKNAIEALLQSRKERKKSSVAVPTWTGKSGSAGIPVFGSLRNNSISKAPSSNDLIQQIKNKDLSVPQDKVSKLIHDLYNYFVAHNHSCSSSQVVNAFRSKVKPDQVILFKKMLKELANFDKRSGTWTLKDNIKNIE
ncbi:hypothetical protein ROZALSC1DRAFT_28781, partial [Rozella allomycis CSF55]